MGADTLDGMDLSALFEHVAAYCPDEALPRLPTSGGVYLLTDAENRVIQLAATADLKRALQHRLAATVQGGAALCGDAPAEGGDAGTRGRGGATQEQDPLAPEDAAAASVQVAEAGEECGNRVGGLEAGKSVPSRRINLSEIVRRIWWRPAHSQFELALEYYRLARVLMPQNYRKLLGFGPAWFVHVDPEAERPQFVAGKFVRSAPDEVDLGPFATQGDAGRFIEILQDTFDLCRYHHILEQSPYGQACAYFEMGKCPAPCDGSIPLTRYREMIAEALRFTCGEHEPVYARLESAMRDAAGEQQYERAAALKKQMDRARGITHSAFRRVGPIADFNYLIVQRGGGTTRLRPFFVRQGAVTSGTAVRRSALAGAAAGWLGEMAGRGPDLDAEERSEQIWLVSHFLFKPDAPGLYLHARELTDADGLVDRMEAHFPLASGRSHSDE